MSSITELVPAGSSPAAGVTWDGRRAVFSRPAESEILAHDLSSGSTAVFRRHTGGVTGLAATPDGSIFGCQTPSRRMVRYHDDGSTTVPCDQLDGLFHNFPTYAAADAEGRVWFADTPLELRAPGPQVFPLLDHGSILRLEATADGWTLRRMTQTTTRPTVVGVSPAGDQLYVADTVDSEQILTVQPLQGDAVGEGRTVARFPLENGSPVLTGLAISPSGTLVLATTGGLITGNADGELAPPVSVGERPTDVAIIDDGSVLVTTESGRLLRAEVPGLD